MKVSIQYAIAGANARDIAASIEDGIVSGRIPSGATLPTVRALAAFLRVSPVTVASAYRALQARGILSGQGRHGTKVCHRPPLLTRPAIESSRFLQSAAYGNPDPALLPSLHTALKRLEVRPRLYGEQTNRPKLLQLAARQFEGDRIPAAHLAILGGALDAVERILQAHLKPGDRVAVEDPGYCEIFDLLSALGLVAEPVALDDFGFIPEDLERVLKTKVAACIFTPRAQNPTGAALDDRRARDLRSLLDKYPDVVVIEDDHAGPIAGVPAFTVCHRQKERWAVVRSVSKSLGPDLRLAVLTGDATTVARVEGRQRLGAGWVSHVLQGLVEVLWSDPTTTERLRTAADTYTMRRDALIAAFARHGIPAHGQSGLNVWVPVREEVEVVAHLAAAGWPARAGERYRIKSAPGIRITISTLQPAEAAKLVSEFTQLFHPNRRTHSA